MGRSIVAVVAGAVVVLVVVTILQMVGAQFHPLPEGLDPGDPADAEALAEHLARMPGVVWGIAFASELVGALLGALTAGMIAPGRKAAFAGSIVALALIGSVFNWTAFAHPAWFMIGQVVGYGLVLTLVTRFLRTGSPA